MAVHFKFNSFANTETITFDGLFISALDVKEQIIERKRLRKPLTCDFIIKNAETKEVYSEESYIPKNTSLVVIRVPLQTDVKIPKCAKIEQVQSTTRDTQIIQNNPEQLNMEVDLTRLEVTEEEKIELMMKQSTMDYAPENFKRIKKYVPAAAAMMNQQGPVPATYRCRKCRMQGHWIKDCPFTKENVPVRTTGIPKSLLERKVIEETPKIIPQVLNTQEGTIPVHLMCNYEECGRILEDAVTMPCCQKSFCDFCVRNYLICEDDQCPNCLSTQTPPENLMPDEELQKAVEAFKNPPIIEPEPEVPIQPEVPIIQPEAIKETLKLFNSIPQEKLPEPQEEKEEEILELVPAKSNKRMQSPEPQKRRDTRDEWKQSNTKSNQDKNRKQFNNHRHRKRENQNDDRRREFNSNRKNDERQLNQPEYRNFNPQRAIQNSNRPRYEPRRNNNKNGYQRNEHRMNQDWAPKQHQNYNKSSSYRKRKRSDEEENFDLRYKISKRY